MIVKDGMLRLMSLPPSLRDIEALTEAAIAALPEDIRQVASGIVVRVEDLASEEMCRDLDLDDPFTLTGLYEGIPLIERSVMDQPTQPDTIWLFRRAILEEWVERGDIALPALVAHVFVHELAHHFGWSDDDIAAIDAWWE